mmetsp:Transcript_42662/g.96056  ORF Transcript_42662/g.96056 Transcript_42662/m.96056 type:complete len:149 (+) Transcript_42662:110-556(+)
MGRFGFARRLQIRQRIMRDGINESMISNLSHIDPRAVITRYFHLDAEVMSSLSANVSDILAAIAVEDDVFLKDQLQQKLQVQFDPYSRVVLQWVSPPIRRISNRKMPESHWMQIAVGGGVAVLACLGYCACSSREDPRKPSRKPYRRV